MPAGFPHSPLKEANIQPLSKKILQKVDFPGAIFLFGTSAFLVAAFEEASTQYAWSSVTVIVLLVLSAVFFLIFLAWQFFLSHRAGGQEAVFPWRLMKQRVFMASLA